ncbi:MAG: PH domain-containing protein [Thermoplasmata archaeon]|nr:PH domain-containing protein [Thermoplasmata archaeon]
MSSGRSYNMPKLLKSTYLAEAEGLLEETRATKLYYFPGPVFGLIVFAIFDLQAAAVAYGWNLSIPGLYWAFHGIGGAIGNTILMIIVLLVTLLLVLWLVVRYLKWITTVYAITTNRVIVQSGILGRDFDQIPITQVRGVDVHQSVGQRILGYGTVRVSSESGASTTIGNEDWLGIPHPFNFQRLIESATQNLARGGVAPPPAPPSHT